MKPERDLDAQPRFDDDPPPEKAKRKPAVKPAQAGKVVKGGLKAALNRAPNVSEEQAEINRTGIAKGLRAAKDGATG